MCSNLHMPQSLPAAPRTAAVTAGLRELADFLDRHPELPAAEYLQRVNVWFPADAAQDDAIWDAAETDGLDITVDPGDGIDTIEVRFGAVAAQAIVPPGRRACCDTKAVA